MCRRKEMDQTVPMCRRKEMDMELKIDMGFSEMNVYRELRGEVLFILKCFLP